MEGSKITTGYLDVKPPVQQRARRKKAWKRRWVVLKPMADLSNQKHMIKMAFFSSCAAWQAGQNDKHILYLEEVTAVQRNKSKSHGHAFQIWQEGEIVVTLAGYSETETQNWLSSLRQLIWPTPVLPPQENAASFLVSLIDNDYSSALGLNGEFWMTIDSHSISLASSLGPNYQTWTWDLSALARFYRGKTISTEDENKILVIVTAKCCQGGAGMFYFYTTDAENILQAIYANVQTAMKELCILGAERESVVDLWFSQPERRWSRATSSGSEEGVTLDPDNPIPGPDPMHDLLPSSSDIEFNKEKEIDFPPYAMPSSEKEAFISANKAKVLCRLSLMAGIVRQRSYSTDSATSLNGGRPSAPVVQKPRSATDTINSVSSKISYVPAIPPEDITESKYRTISNSSVVSQISSPSSKDSGIVSSASHRPPSARLDDFNDIPEDNSMQSPDIPVISVTHQELDHGESPSCHRSLPDIQLNTENELEGESPHRIRSLSSVSTRTPTDNTVSVSSSLTYSSDMPPPIRNGDHNKCESLKSFDSAMDQTEILSSSSSSEDTLDQEQQPKLDEHQVTKIKDNVVRKISTTSHIYLELDAVVEQYGDEGENKLGLLPDEIPSAHLTPRPTSVYSSDGHEDLGSPEPIFRKSLYKFFGESVEEVDPPSMSPKLQRTGDVPPPLPQRPKSLPPIERPRERKKGIFGTIMRQNKDKKATLRSMSKSGSTSSEDDRRGSFTSYQSNESADDRKRSKSTVFYVPNDEDDVISTTSESDDDQNEHQESICMNKSRSSPGVPFPNLIAPISATFGSELNTPVHAGVCTGRLRASTDATYDKNNVYCPKLKHKRCKSMDFSPLHETDLVTINKSNSIRDINIDSIRTKNDSSEELRRSNTDPGECTENLMLEHSETVSEPDEETYLSMSKLSEAMNESDVSETYIDMGLLQQALAEDSEV